MFKTGTTSLCKALRLLGYHSVSMNSEPGLTTTNYWDFAPWYNMLDGFYGWASDDISFMFYQNEIIEHILVNSDISYNFGDAPMLFAYHLFDQYYSVPPNINSNINVNMNTSMLDNLSFDGYRFGNLTNMDNGAKFILTVRNSTWEVVNSDIKMAVRNQNSAQNIRRKYQRLQQIPVRCL